jgi:hypothetical protein
MTLRWTAPAFALALAVLILIIDVTPAFATCANLTSALEGLESPEFLKPGAIYEEGILSGEMPRELNAARRDRTKQLQENPALATQLSKSLGQPSTPSTRSAGEILFGLDLLGRSNPKLFVDAVDGMVNSTKGVTSVSPALGDQLTSRMISHLGLTKPEDSIRLVEAMSKNPWARQYLAADNNAPRSLLSAMKQISEAAKTDRAIAAKLPAFKTLVNDWIEPRAKRAMAGNLKAGERAYNDDMDWALSRVLASEMAQVLKATDPAGAQKLQALAGELAHVKDAAEMSKYERVDELFKEYGIKP